MPKPRRPHVASPDEIKLTRNGDEVIIQYADPKVATTHLQMGKAKLDRVNLRGNPIDWSEQAANIQALRDRAVGGAWDCPYP